MAKKQRDARVAQKKAAHLREEEDEDWAISQ